MFLCKLNTLDPYIKFTCEQAKPGIEVGLSSDVLEALPFLDFLVMRHMDPITNALSHKLGIYRKNCHSASYVHSLSNQPTSVKRAVIRNMFLRAYRYCDSLFMELEERKIYEDFGNLGYSPDFITKAKLAAKQGRTRELRIRSGHELPREPRERADFNIRLPYHVAVNSVKHKLASKGVDVIFTNIDSIKSRLTIRKKRQPSTAGVYILKCKKTDCEQVYVGQSGDIATRLTNHSDAKTRPSMKRQYASAKHMGDGHEMDTSNERVAYRSDHKPHRLAVETSLISVCKTIRGNKASTSVRDIETLAPKILGGTRLNWNIIFETQPHCLPPEIIPLRHRKPFENLRRLTGPLQSENGILTTQVATVEPRSDQDSTSDTPGQNLRTRTVRNYLS